MSNRLIIFENQTIDADSILFKISPRDSKGVSDTEYSAYFEIYGELGGGTLSLQKKCFDGTFRELEEDSAELYLPSSGKCSVEPINFKSNDIFKLVLSGATAASLTIIGINIQAA